ncbi:MAG: PKD domain-containing protein [Bacteroidota bacterium]
MSTDNYNRFDELIREKLDSYEAEPDMDLLVNIHARKNRFLKSRNLLTIIALLAILMAGIIGGYYLSGTGNERSQQTNEEEGLSLDGKADNPLGGNGGAPSNLQPSAKQAFLLSANQGSAFTGKQSGNTSTTPSLSSTKQASAKNTGNMLRTGRNKERSGNRTLSDVVITADKIKGNEVQNPAADADNDKAKNKNDKTTDECTAAFDYYSSYDHSFHFMPHINASANVSVNWQFGDGESSKELNPKHIYTKAGQYAVTLTAVNTKTNCKAEVYKLISVAKGIELTSTTIKGTVFADAEYAGKILVQLVEPNGNIIQRTITNTKGYYEFNEVGAGNYLVKTSGYKHYSSTYYGNAVQTEYATNIAVFKDDYEVLSGYDIQMIANMNHGENSTAQSDSGSKLMIIMDENNNPVTTVVMNANGKIISSNKLPAGNYTMLDAQSGKPSGGLSVGNDGSSSVQPKDNLISENQSAVTLSPNPAGHYVNVGLTNAGNSPIDVTIINYGGAIVKQFTLPSGSTSSSVDINSLSGGSYHVIVKQNGITVTSTLVKGSDNTK